MKQLCRLVTLLLLVIAAHTSVAENKYNVLFIAVDDLRPQLGSYGHGMIKSPNLDRLAQESLQFNRAYCQFALCNPSRVSLLTGKRPETVKVYDLATFLRDRNPGVVTLPQLFKQNGYRSLNFGKIFHYTNGNHDDPESWSAKPWHSKKDDPQAAAPTPKPKTAEPKKITKAGDPHADELPYGAPEVDDEELLDGITATRAIEALRAMKGESFFLAVGFHKPHAPFVAPKKYWDLYDAKDIKLPTNDFHPKNAPAFASNDASEMRRYKGVPKTGPIPEDLARKMIHGYYASVSYVDAQIGKVITELDRLNLRDKTIIVLWGDHGYQLGEHGTWNKRTNWEIATRVPLFVSAPNQKAKGKATDALVELVDIYPTLAELCGIQAPPGLEGTSLVPLFKNHKQSWKTAAFSLYVKEVPELGKGNCFGRAMRTDRYRFVEWSVAGNNKRVYELYDHKNDPEENVSIANLPENKDLVVSLAKQLQAGWQEAAPNRR